MADGLNFVTHLANYIGETVTIFTTSGGESGSGFTGVLISVNNSYVRLITQIGPAPACSLGNCCSGIKDGSSTDDFDGVVGGTIGGRASCSVNTIGAVVDIPLNRIASFVHNAV